MDIQHASALVTGAGRGIGRAVALALARAGAGVTAVARTASELDSLTAEVRAAGGRAVSLAADLRAPGAPAAAVARAVEAHGGLQILVNNAGVGLRAPVAETGDDDWERVIGTNLTAVFRLTRAALPHLARGGGQVFMISSLAGTNAIAGMAAYCASKAALDHFSQCLMLEVRHQGIKVTVIAPGSVDTGFGQAAAGSSAGSSPPSSSSSSSWALAPEDVAATVLDLLRGRDQAHLSRIEMRPSRPPQRA